MPATPSTNDPATARRIAWQRKLRRLRLGAEPIEDQLRRLRRATWAGTVVAGWIGLFILGLFTAFGRPLIGLAFGGGLSAPILAWMWASDLRTHRLARRYVEEEAARAGSSANPSA